MKIFFAGIFVITSLFFASGCSSIIKSGDAQVAEDEMHHTNHGHNSHGEHEGHLKPHTEHSNNSKTTTQAKLIADKKITPNQPVNFEIEIQDSGGKSVSNFDNFQEKLMHLIVVRDDLQTFDHLHPNYKNNGRFEVSTSFPSSGNYTLFSDYKPSGQQEQVSLLKVMIPGQVPQPIEAQQFNTTKILPNTKVNLKFSEPNLKAGKEVNLIFDLQDTAKNQPIQDLQPYLGEQGHLVIVKNSSPLTRPDYIHAHALKNSPTGQINFMTSFPKPGKYKLWVQFNRNGKINTADFWVNVQ
ncbi:MAG: hypothetical protein KME32_26975 [Mojavia pulchra JT2-VF2]|jgi:hypothetical protein|uniref:YtkA-like domain-containing protein n=1 Tax=Mojavia pulchra JT2-VF2 TaxID=287848 RepID=A0A951Q2T9_9NOST|nr:hypothetical protein [Mojavia pulchra JT2-VF2]